MFKKIRDWLIKPKSFNATVCWIFTLAAIAPISAWLILGDSGIIIGGALGSGFMMCGLIVALMTTD